MKKIKIHLLVLILSAIIIGSCQKDSKQFRYDCALKYPHIPDGALVKRTLPILNKLCLVENPSLGEQFTIIYNFKYDRRYTSRPIEQKNANATIHLGDGLELVEGNPNWKGTLIEKKEEKIKIKVRAPEAGRYSVGASVYVEGWGAIGDYFMISMDEAGSAIIERD